MKIRFSINHKKPFIVFEWSCRTEYLPGADFLISCTVWSIADFSDTEAAVGDNGGHPEHAGTHEAMVCKHQTE